MRVLRTSCIARRYYHPLLSSSMLTAPAAPAKPTFSSLFSHLPFASTTETEKVSTPPSVPNNRPAFTDSNSRPSHHPSQTSRQHRQRPHTNTKQNKTEDYRFPIGRALRYIRIGQHLRRQEYFFSEEVGALLQASRECGSETDTTAGRFDKKRGVLLGEEEENVDIFGHFWRTDGVDTTHHHSQEETPTAGEEVETLSSEEREKIERFLKYHMHHVIVSYKRRRKTLQEQDYKKQNNGASSSSSEAVGVVTSYILYASLLLHLSALFGFSGSSTNQQQMIEKLIQTVFSCSIFLSQYLRRSRANARGGRKRKHVAAHPLHEDAFGGFFQLLTPTCMNSLHWGVIHFCEGVRVWELQCHQYALQPITLHASSVGAREGAPKTVAPSRDPYHALLQTHARLVLALMPRDATSLLHGSKGQRKKKAVRAVDNTFQMPTALQDALVQLGGNEAAQERTHAVLKWMGEYMEANHSPGGLLQYQTGDAIETPQAMHIQNRRLQLLPLFWTALLSHGVVHQPQPPSLRKEENVHTSPLDLRAARHALRAVIPLFHNPGAQENETATVEPSFFYLLTLLYAFPLTASPCSSVALATEFLALLAVLEKHHVLKPQMWQTQHLLWEHERHRRDQPILHKKKEHHTLTADALPKNQKAFVRQNFLLFFENWFRQHEQQRAQTTEGRGADLIRLKGKKELYLSLSNLPVSLLVVPSLAALSDTTTTTTTTTTTAADRHPSSSPPLWATLRKELPWLYTATLLRHLAQWPVTVPALLAGADSNPTSAAIQQQREMVSFVEELEVTLKAVMRLMRFIMYKEGEAAEKEKAEASRHVATFDCLLEKQLLRLIAFQLGCEVYPRRRLQQMEAGAEEDNSALVALSTREKELMLAIHRCLMPVLAAKNTATSASNASREQTSSFLEQGQLHPEYTRQLHLLLKA